MNSAAIEQAADLFRRRDILLEELQGIDRQLSKWFGQGTNNGHEERGPEVRAEVLSPEHPLRLYMAKHNLSQKDLAVKLKCSHGSVYGWITGKSEPIGDLREKVKNLLGQEEFERMLRWPQSSLGRRVATSSR